MAKPSQTGSRSHGTQRRSGIPDKCRKCAMLSAEQAQTLHGPQGTDCWNPSVCYSRRSYARHRDRINQTRSRRRRSLEPDSIAVPLESLAGVTFAVLVVYRPAGTDTPVHAIGAEIWQGQEKTAIVPAIHCMGLVPSQVHTYLERMLALLETQYGIKKFASQVRFDPSLCPIQPCPLKP